ncbi:hypothetical protein [Sphingobacterium athyrii]|uniref:Uncharacterized protein n=1 Tax=Sphingobacterium athyrii TaxID=2152717 RepID=A0A363NQ17_9SPHI|nr:hypothetical protein [Sphingobacterium athyrii]PUV22853.1 hypothetical protein DCO56_18185 [Sphingobacterium athyrii]
MLFDTDYILFLFYLPSMITTLVGLGMGIYWFGRVPAAKYTFNTKLLLERVLICYIIMFTAIAVLVINSCLTDEFFGNYLSADILWIGVVIAILGFVFTTIFVAFKSIVFWSEAYSRGRKKCQWYLALLPLWLSCFLGQMIAFIWVIKKMG